jgi:hypothetical protein
LEENLGEDFAGGNARRGRIEREWRRRISHLSLDGDGVKLSPFRRNSSLISCGFPQLLMGCLCFESRPLLEPAGGIECPAATPAVQAGPGDVIDRIKFSI